MFSLQTIFGSGKQFYDLLDEAAEAAHDSTQALYAMLKAPEKHASLDAFKLARQRQRVAADKINHALVDNFITPIEREDIESLGSALYKIPKQVERFADRYDLARHRLEDIDFAPRAAMLEQASAVVVEMVKALRSMKLEPMSQLNQRLRVLEMEADRLILELHREIYSGRMDAADMFLLKEFFEILEKAIDRCREAGVVAYQIVLKNS
ncbi:pit accessory protein [Lysobacter pythonis]|uniref:Pit accessory protein n=1 Tax=Solilutibacter pythonis TaxID=2483112 RepID=A0A3M2HX11_9GAMM|nr:pit accessory protein [Lysobacter pythonis]RMH93608.1 pit accessory protein [Lysobacter pythonis]